MRLAVLAAVAALAFASNAFAAVGAGGHVSGGSGAGKVRTTAVTQCRDPHGKFMKCPAPQPPKRCRDPKTGRFVSCVIKDNNGHPITDASGHVITGH